MIYKFNLTLKSIATLDLAKEETALLSQFNTYSTRYKDKAVPAMQRDNYMRFTAHTHLLILSHCRNILHCAPEKLEGPLQQLGQLFQDLLNKYKYLALKENQQTTSESHKTQPGNLSRMFSGNSDGMFSGDLDQCKTNRVQTDLRKTNKVESGRLQFGEMCKLQSVQLGSRNYGAVQVCSVCGQLSRKVRVQAIRKSLMNEMNLFGQNECQQGQKESEDTQFFQEVNSLLNNKQEQLYRNQMELVNYQDIIHHSAATLHSLTEIARKEPSAIPMTSWLPAAQEQMQHILKTTFQAKIPQWISKMFGAFWNRLRCHLHDKTHNKQHNGLQQSDNQSRPDDKVSKGIQSKSQDGSQVILKGKLLHMHGELQTALQNELEKMFHGNLRQAEAQTEDNWYSQMLQMKKKLVVAKNTQAKLQQQIKDSSNSILQRKELQIKVDYYKSEITKLISECEALKNQNQLIKIKINKMNEKAESQTDIVPSADNITVKKKKNDHCRSSQMMGFPRLRATQADSQHQSNRTSIQLSSLNATDRHKHFKHRTTNVSRFEPHLSDQQQTNSHSHIKSRQGNSQNKSRVQIDQQPLTSHSIQRGRMKGLAGKEQVAAVVEEVSSRLQTLASKNKKNSQFYNTLNVNNNTFIAKSNKKNLKKVAIKRSEPQSTRQSLLEVPTQLKIPQSRFKQASSNHKSVNEVLSVIFNHLRESGCLIDMSELNFKEVILNIKELNFNLLQQVKTNRNVFSQALRSIKQAPSCSPSYVVMEQPKEEGRSAQEFMGLFVSEVNAYNYQRAMTKNNFKGVRKLTAQEEQFSSQLYRELERIKTQSTLQYGYICSFLRYPYEVIQNKFEVVSMVADMKQSSLQQCLQRIMPIHENCPKTDGVCQHIQQLRHHLQKPSN